MIAKSKSAPQSKQCCVNFTERTDSRVGIVVVLVAIDTPRATFVVLLNRVVIALLTTRVRQRHPEESIFPDHSWSPTAAVT
jgi:hypothetical protein